MKKLWNVIDDIHPKDLLYSEKTLVESYDNKYDLIQRLNIEHEKYGSGIRKFLKEIKELKMDEAHVEKVKNTVRNSLIKRGIVTGTIYEGYKYDIDGEIVDHAELASGNPRCFMKPIKKYDKYFYELYINMSIPWSVSKNDIEDGAIKLVETIKLLEERNIEIKINVVLFTSGMFVDGDDWLFILPLCSHLEFKDYRSIFPYISENFLRNVLFSIMYNQEKNVDDSLGIATKLDNTVNLWELDEVELCERVLNDLDLHI